MTSDGSNLSDFSDPPEKFSCKHNSHAAKKDATMATPDTSKRNGSTVP